MILANITVTPATSNPRQSSGRSTQSPVSKYCPHFPKNLTLNPRFPLPPPLPGSNVTSSPQQACSYATGFTNAQKLHEAVLVGPGLTDLNLALKNYFKSTRTYSYFAQRAAGQLEYQGLPELPTVRATLLAFGFMPVSATIQLSEIGSLNIALISCGDASDPTKSDKCPNPPPKNAAILYGSVMLRIHDVAINGVPLNVGDHCQTATPFDLDLVGVPPSYIVSALHGVLTGTVTVPQFTGCANGSDDLDSIFDATVSGPNNFIKVNQAVYCSPTVPPPNECPPAIPPPKH
jgi:hypothetical protein